MVIWRDIFPASNLAATGVGPSNVAKPTRSEGITSTQSGTDIYVQTYSDHAI